MEDHTNQFESLFERAVEYGKTGYELTKLKALDKTSDVVSSLISHYAVLILVATFMLFITLGLAFWLGEILGKIYFGFFAVAAFYGFTGIVVHFLIHDWLKKCISDYIIKRMLK